MQGYENNYWRDSKPGSAPPVVKIETSILYPSWKLIFFSQKSLNGEWEIIFDPPNFQEGYKIEVFIFAAGGSTYHILAFGRKGKLVYFDWLVSLHVLPIRLLWTSKGTFSFWFAILLQRQSKAQRKAWESLYIIDSLATRAILAQLGGYMFIWKKWPCMRRQGGTVIVFLPKQAWTFFAWVFSWLRYYFPWSAGCCPLAQFYQKSVS